MTAPQANVDELVAALEAHSATAAGVRLHKPVFNAYWKDMAASVFQKRLREDRVWLAEQLADLEKRRRLMEERLVLLAQCEARLEPILEADAQQQELERKRRAAEGHRTREALRAKFLDPRTSEKDRTSVLLEYCRWLMDRPSKSGRRQCAVGPKFISPGPRSEFKGKVSLDDGWVYDEKGKRKPRSFVFDWVRDERGLRQVDRTEFEETERSSGPVVLVAHPRATSEKDEQSTGPVVLGALAQPDRVHGQPEQVQGGSEQPPLPWAAGAGQGGPGQLEPQPPWAAGPREPSQPWTRASCPWGFPPAHDPSPGCGAPPDPSFLP